MANSDFTKFMIARGLKQLLETRAFTDVTVGDIARHCKMSRNTFYYHFKDKYDLVNWIFDTEFIALLKDEKLNASHSNYKERWACIEKICQYFYQNHGFYRKALQIKGQNSFSEHFREYIRPLLANRIFIVFGEERLDEFVLDFFTDAVICAMERWLLTRECMPPEQFVEKIKQITEECARSIYRELSEAEQEMSQAETLADT